MLISSEIISLRRLSTNDLAAFLAYRNDPEVGRYQSWDVMDAQRAEGFLHAVGTEELFRPGHWSQIGIADADDNLIGDLGIRISEDAKEAELGITLTGQAQGQGLGEAASRLGFALIWRDTPAEVIRIWTLRENVGAQRLINRLNLERLEDEHSTAEDGTPIVEFAYRLLRPR